MDNCTTTDEPVKEPPPGVIRILLATIILVILSGVMTNSFIIISFCKVKLLRTVTNYFIFNLAIADMLLLITQMMWLSCEFIPLGMTSEQGAIMYRILTAMDIFCSSASLTSLACVSIDRCLAITRPLRYQAISTHSRALVAVIIVWIYCSLTFAYSYIRDVVELVLYDKVYIMCLFACTFILPIVITTVSYYRIFRAVWHQVHHNSAQSAGQGRRFIMKEFRVAINILVTILPFYFMWGGFWIDALKVAVLGSPTQYPLIISWLISNAPYIAAAINPIIYISMTRDFRLLCVKLLSCKRNQNNFNCGNQQRSIVSLRSFTMAQRAKPNTDRFSSDELNKSHGSATSDTRSSSGQCASTDSSCITSSPVEQEKGNFPELV